VSDESLKNVGHCRDLDCCDHDSGRDLCCDPDYDFVYDFDCYWGYADGLMTKRNMMRRKRWRKKKRRRRYAR
jgi:hypothetical protein